MNFKDLLNKLKIKGHNAKDINETTNINVPTENETNTTTNNYQNTIDKQAFDDLLLNGLEDNTFFILEGINTPTENETHNTNDATTQELESNTNNTPIVLTPLELDIYTYIVNNGYNQKAIMDKFELTQTAINRLVKSLKRKYDVRDLYALIINHYKTGI